MVKQKLEAYISSLECAITSTNNCLKVYDDDLNKNYFTTRLYLLDDVVSELKTILNCESNLKINCMTCNRRLNEKGKEVCDIAKNFGSDQFYCCRWDNLVNKKGDVL